MNLDQIKCPRCRAVTSGSVEVSAPMGTSMRKPGAASFLGNILSSKLFIIGLFLVAVFMVYHSWIAPYQKVPVKFGKITICGDTGKIISSVETKNVKKIEMDNYQVATSSILCDIYKNRDMTALGKLPFALKKKRQEAEQGISPDQSAAESADRYPGKNNQPPDFQKMVAFYIAQKQLALNMTKEMVTATWGSPVSTDTTLRDGMVLERWVYGDPIYGIPLSDRFADFNKDGKLINFSDNKKLDKLFVEVMDEKRKLEGDIDRTMKNMRGGGSGASDSNTNSSIYVHTDSN